MVCMSDDMIKGLLNTSCKLQTRYIYTQKKRFCYIFFFYSVFIGVYLCVCVCMLCNYPEMRGFTDQK